jgi:hypothetical protein
MVELPVLDSHRFRILHPLDRGGISRVYVAYDEELNRMAMAPEDRYVSAIDLGDDIACWLAKRPVTARPTTASRDRVADPAIWSGQKIRLALRDDTCHGKSRFRSLIRTILNDFTRRIHVRQTGTIANGFLARAFHCRDRSRTRTPWSWAAE